MAFWHLCDKADSVSKGISQELNISQCQQVVGNNLK